MKRIMSCGKKPGEKNCRRKLFQPLDLNTKGHLTEARHFQKIQEGGFICLVCNEDIKKKILQEESQVFDQLSKVVKNFELSYLTKDQIFDQFSKILYHGEKAPIIGLSEQCPTCLSFVQIKKLRSHFDVCQPCSFRAFGREQSCKKQDCSLTKMHISIYPHSAKFEVCDKAVCPHSVQLFFDKANEITLIPSDDLDCSVRRLSSKLSEQNVDFLINKCCCMDNGKKSCTCFYRILQNFCPAKRVLKVKGNTELAKLVPKKGRKAVIMVIENDPDKPKHPLYNPVKELRSTSIKFFFVTIPAIINYFKEFPKCKNSKSLPWTQADQSDSNDSDPESD